MKYKCSSWLTLPVTTGIILAGRGNDRKLLKTVESTLHEIVEYAQIQNDYFTIFPSHHDKHASTTIVNWMESMNLTKEISWWFVQAASCSRVDAEAFQFLRENLPTTDANVWNRIEQILEQAGISKRFREEMETRYRNILENIRVNFETNSDGKGTMLSNLFVKLLNEA